MDLVVLEKLIDPCFLDIDEFAPNGQDRLVPSIAPLFGGAAGGITLDDVQFGQLRIAFTAIRQFSRKSASSQRAFSNRLPRLACRFPCPRSSQHFFKNAPRDRRILIEVSH